MLAVKRRRASNISLRVPNQQRNRPLCSCHHDTRTRYTWTTCHTRDWPVIYIHFMEYRRLRPPSRSTLKVRSGIIDTCARATVVRSITDAEGFSGCEPRRPLIGRRVDPTAWRVGNVREVRSGCRAEPYPPIRAAPGRGLCLAVLFLPRTDGRSGSPGPSGG